MTNFVTMKCVSFFCLCFGISNIAASCRSSWSPFKNSCYFASSTDMVKTFSDAKIFCQNLRSHLVEIDSSEEQAFLETLILNTHSQHDFWIGAEDSTKEGYWTWSGSNFQMVYKHWCPDEPNDALNGEDCAAINVNGKSVVNYCWNDYKCNSPHNFICEIRDLPTTTEITTSQATTGQLIWRTIA